MKDKTDFVINTSEFSISLQDVSTEILDIAKFALWEATAMLKIFCDEIPPKTPHLYGNLRGDAGRTVSVKNSVVMPDWFPEITRENTDTELSCTLTYRAPYAARWHEAVDPEPNWSEANDGVGAKYVEAKLTRSDLMDKLFELITKRIASGAIK